MNSFKDVPMAPFRPIRVKLGRIASTATIRRFTVQERDLDPLAHVNNATYLDLATESLGPLGRLPRQWTVEYARPVAPGESLTATTWVDDDGTWRYLLAGSDGVERFRALLKRSS